MGVFHNPPITLGLQDRMMQRDFPGFIYSRVKNVPTWRGTLQPSDMSPSYLVKVEYKYPKSPKVWVVSPKIKPGAKHKYSDDSLCLYFPKDGSWNPQKFISQTIIPWTSLWLYFYEIWLETDCWYGPEAPHDGPKRG